MAINKNHEVEELGGTRCAIVEKNVSQQRADFLAHVLRLNKYTVVVEPSPAPKAAAVAKPGTEVPLLQVEAPPAFTVAVTDVTFNPINAIFGRLLKTSGGQVVTLSYWQQKEATPNDEVPYFDYKDSIEQQR
ncbi:hypothetical protein EXU57_04125 [Segetibacter sp. 3557_3]|uniref:hypothetical protein n=1 Tax=Segetibacter sp. 3557_3 TaxID=2547429 RepID=UPI001058E11E|nr:hypothetical protein [Segetibacter sp. 3557_3]TDH29259.1 hypothetical protein EXU57_04125 [Segetibacter sp. 3557_3]